MAVWEYKIIDDWLDGNPDHEDELNDLGREGWELVTCQKVVARFDDGTLVQGAKRWYFKRLHQP